MAHGITITEVNEGARALVTVATAVIGIVCTGPAADATAFPLDRPVLVTDLPAAIGLAGATGTLKQTLTSIADQVKTPVVVVRVAPGNDQAATNAAVIGTETNGVKSGMQALLAAEAQLGVRPRILGAPGLDTSGVTAALVVLAQKLRGMAYAAAIGANTAAAITYAGGFSARELMLIYPDVKSLVAGSAANVPAVAAALGLRARIDQEQGWHKTLSNVAMGGVVGLSKDVGFDLLDGSSEAGLLNAANVTAVVNSRGFRFWGSRTCSDDALFAFESATRTAQVLYDTIGQGMMWAIDKPLTRTLVIDIVETINAEIRAMVGQGRLLGGRAFFRVADNPEPQLAGGKVVIDFEFTPVPPLEHLAIRQRITDRWVGELYGAAAVQA